MTAWNQREAGQVVRDGLRSQGLTVTKWARARGFIPDIVHAVLSGAHQGRAGEGRQVFRALGWPLPAAMPRPSNMQRQRKAVWARWHHNNKRGGKAHLKLHVDGRIEPIGVRARA